MHMLIQTFSAFQTSDQHILRSWSDFGWCCLLIIGVFKTIHRLIAANQFCRDLWKAMLSNGGVFRSFTVHAYICIYIYICIVCMRVDIYIYTYICKYILYIIYTCIYIFLFIDILTVDGSRLDIHYNGKLKKMREVSPLFAQKNWWNSEAGDLTPC